MSASTPSLSQHRLLTFEVADALYALPISGVLEVAELGRRTCVPTLPRNCAGVMNWHGDALPVLAPDRVLGGAAPSEEPEREHVLVVSERGDENAQLGLPVDRVVGLVDSGEPCEPASRGALVVERRPVEGRIVNVLDPRALVARARSVIEGAAE